MATLLNTLITALSTVIVPAEEKLPAAVLLPPVEVTVLQEECFVERPTTCYLFL